MDKPTFIVLNLNNVLKTKSLYLHIAKFFSNFELLLACAEGYKSIDMPNAKEYIFNKAANSDEIINTLIAESKNEELVIARALTNDSFDNLIQLANNVKSSNQIALFEKQRKMFSKVFKRISDIVIKFLYNFEVFDGNISLIAFGKSASLILKQLPGASMFTKVNKWSGMDIVYLKGESAKISFKQKKAGKIATLCCCFAVVLGFILCLILFKPFSSGILFFVSLLSILCGLLFGTLNIFMLVLDRKIGKLRTEKAQPLKIFNNFDEK